MRTTIVVFLQFCILLGLSLTNACTFYVSTNGDNTFDGKTPSTAFATLKFALNSGNNVYLKSNDKVCVFPGIYQDIGIQADTSVQVYGLTTPLRNNVILQSSPGTSSGVLFTITAAVTFNTTFAISNIVFQGDGVTHFVSYSAINVTNCTFQNSLVKWNGYLVQLFAPSVFRDVTFQNLSTTSATMFTTSSSAQLYNITIIDCFTQATTDGSYWFFGGTATQPTIIDGLYVVNNVGQSLTLIVGNAKNIVFTNNVAIQQLQMFTMGSGSIQDSRFEYSTLVGGQNYNNLPVLLSICDPPILLERVIFQYNEIPSVSISLCGTTGVENLITINNCTFQNNLLTTAVATQGGTPGGAAIFFIPQYMRPQMTITMSDSSFVNNSAPFGSGGAIYNAFAQQTVPNQSPTTITIKRCTFLDNSASNGGALALTDGTISECTFDQNIADSQGGAIMVYPGSILSLSISNSLFNCNRGSSGAVTSDIQGAFINHANNVFHDSCGASLLSIDPSSGTTLGGTWLTITGSQFPPNPQVTIGSFDCILPQQIDNSTLRCQTSAGYGGGLVIIVSAAGYLPSISALTWSYDAPFVQSFSPTNGPTIGQNYLTITGGDFVQDQTSVSIGPYKCNTIQVSTSLIVCQVTAGFGCNLFVQVSVGNQNQSSQVQIYSYDSPSIVSITPLATSPVGLTNFTIIGKNFAQDQSYGMFVMELNELVGQIYVQSNTMLFWFPATHLTGNINIKLQTVGRNCTQVSNVVLYSFAPASLRSATPTNLRVSGGTRIELIGDNFVAFSAINMLCRFDNVTVPMYVTSATSGYCFSYYHVPGTSLLSISNSAGQVWSSTLPLTYFEGCEPGFYGDLEGDNCQPCSMGTYSPKFGLEQCLLCGPGTYANNVSSTTCFNCPSFSSTQSIGSTTLDQCLCQNGFVWTNFSTSCVPCPTGAVCVGGKVPAISDEGYYQSPFTSQEFYPCPNANCLGDNTCANGYHDFLCNECSPGFWQLEGACFECSSGVWAWLVVLVIVGIASVTVSIHLTRVEDDTTAGQINEDDKVQIDKNKPRVAMIVSTLVSFYQLWKAVSNTDSNPLLRTTGTIMKYMMYALNVVQFDLKLASPQCLASNNNWSLKQEMILMVLIPVGIIPLFALASFILKRRYSAKSILLANCRVYAMIVCALYLPILQMSIQYLDCVDIIGDSNTWIRTEPSIQCNIDSYRQFLPVPILIIIIMGLGLPVTIVLIVNSKQASVVSIFGFLVEGIQPSSRFKFAIDMCIKLITALILVLHTSPVVQLVFLFGMYYAYYQFLRVKQPYIRSEYNVMDARLFASLCIFVLVMIVRISNTTKGASNFVDVLTFLCFIPTFVFTLYLAVQSIWIDRNYIFKKCKWCGCNCCRDNSSSRQFYQLSSV